MTGDTIYGTGKAAYTCEKGYILVGTNVRVCEHGKWDGDEPICKREFVYQYLQTSGSCLVYITVSNIFFSIYSTGVFCKVLTDPYGGAVTVNNRTVGAVAHYKCYLGHNMYGQATRECHADGQWFPAVPLCKSESKHFKVEEHGLTSCSFL